MSNKLWRIIFCAVLIFLLLLTLMAFTATDSREDLGASYLAVGFMAIMAIFLGSVGLRGMFIKDFPTGKTRSLFIKPRITDYFMKKTLGKGVFAQHSGTLMKLFSLISLIFGVYLFILLIWDISLPDTHVVGDNLYRNVGVFYMPEAMLPVSIIACITSLAAMYAYFKAYPIADAPNKVAAILIKSAVILVFSIIGYGNFQISYNYILDIGEEPVVAEATVTEKYYHFNRKLYDSTGKTIPESSGFDKCYECSYSNWMGREYLEFDADVGRLTIAVDRDIYDLLTVGDNVDIKYHPNSQELIEVEFVE